MPSFSEPSTRRAPPYKVEWATEAWTEVQALRVFDRRAIMQAVAELAHQAESETQNRKPLRKPLEDLPEAMWEVRVQARYRLLYGIYRVVILRAIIKDRETTAQAVRRKR